MKIAVIGAGIFGITTSLFLDKEGHDVYLFERNDAIMREASLGNQFRLHRGYHYPRSPETVDALRAAAPEFNSFYSKSINKENKHYYCIAKKDSFVSSKEYLDFCNRHNLNYKVVDDCPVSKESIDISLLVEENLISYKCLHSQCSEMLNNSSVKVLLSTEFVDNGFDAIVNCTYSNINQHSKNKKSYQFELCEKILVKLPLEFEAVSIVVMDGPFMCIDPFENSYHLMGNVVHAIHETNIGTEPKVSDKYAPYLSREFSEAKNISKFNKFIESGKKYIPGLKDAEYIASKFVIRSVLPNVEDTDERPTIVNMHENTVDVFSGKIDTCVSAAKQVVQLLS